MSNLGKNVKVAVNFRDEHPFLFLHELREGSKGSITVMVCRKWDVNNIKGRCSLILEGMLFTFYLFLIAMLFILNLYVIVYV